MDDFIEGLLSIRIDRIFPITPKIPIVLNSIPPIAKSKMRKFAVNKKGGVLFKITTRPVDFK